MRWTKNLGIPRERMPLASIAFMTASTWPRRAFASRFVSCSALLAALVLSGCGGEQRTVPAHAVDEATSARGIGLLEVDITLDGKAQATSTARWIDPAVPADERKTALAVTGISTGLELKLQSSSAVDVGTRGVDGMRYLSATYQIRNAQSCGTPGTCTPYGIARSNLTFIATTTTNTVNQTAVSRFLRFDGSAASSALAPLMLPTHGMLVTGTKVDDARASLVTYRESELPAVPSGATGLLAYGFAVSNATDNSRTLPANPASNQYDGVVTFAFKIPLQASASDDPFKISVVLYSVEDSRIRVAQSAEEANFAGDLTATARVNALGGEDLSTLGGRLSQTTVGNPICTVRIAGTPASPTAYLANNVDASPRVRAAPANLSNVSPSQSVSVGSCSSLNVPTASTFVVHGMHSGPRVAGGAYGGSLQGGGSSDRPNQLVWALGSGIKPFFRGETVHFSATAGNTASGGGALSAFVGTYQVAGSVSGSAGTFASPTTLTLPSSSGPVAQAVVDVNGDGYLDLVVARFFASSLSIYLGDGAGGFAAPTTVSLGSTPEAVVLGDLNGDGKLDVVAALMNINAVAIRMGDGTGGFGAQTNIATGSGKEPRALALGDLNGDGKLDIVIGNQGDGTVGVLLNNGSGSFPSTPTYYSAGSGTTGVVVGDFNHDGVLDIATANYYSSSISVLLGNGNGTFGSAANTSTGSGPRGIAVGDLNGDGKLDLVTADQTGNTVSVFLGNGNGTFGTRTAVSVGTGPRAVAIADFNGDGKADVVTANQTAGTASFLLGSTSGTLTLSSTITAGSGAYFVSFGDLDRDGKLDLVISNFSGDSLSQAKGQ